DVQGQDTARPGRGTRCARATRGPYTAQHGPDEQAHPCPRHELYGPHSAPCGASVPSRCRVESVSSRSKSSRVESRAETCPVEAASSPGQVALDSRRQTCYSRTLRG